MSIYPGDHPLSRAITAKEFLKLELYPELLKGLELCLFAVTDDATANDGKVDTAAVAMLCQELIKKARGLV